jgi:hypothetical protein
LNGKWKKQTVSKGKKERKKERRKKENLSRTYNKVEDEFTLHVVDNSAFGAMGTVFTQPFTKICIYSHPLGIHVEG